MLSITKFTFSKALLISEILVQLVVVITESISNSLFRRFPPSSVMMGYTGQSLLVIIVSILNILITILVLRNLGRVLVQTAWKISISCIGFSLASIAFRTFSAWFVLSPSDQYYVSTYNITSYFIVLGAIIWVPFIFCKTSKYMPETQRPDAERYRIRSTAGERRLFTHRPHQDEDNQSIITSGAGEALPSYYEMIPPPSYKNITPSINNSNSSNGQPPNNSVGSTNERTIEASTNSDTSGDLSNNESENQLNTNTEDRAIVIPSLNFRSSTVIEMGEIDPPITLSDDNRDQEQSSSQLNQTHSSSQRTSAEIIDIEAQNRPAEGTSTQST